MSKNEQGGYKTLTLRLIPEDWIKLDNLARDERTSVQRLLVDILNEEFKRRRLPGLETNKIRAPRW